jgi:hypothetical protein
MIVKKYANGRFFDTKNKRYIKKDQLEKMLKKGEKVKVILTKTGKDITKTISSKSTVKGKKKDDAFLSPEGIKRWIGDNIDLDRRINKVLNMMNLPSKDQVAKLSSSLKSLTKKVDDLEKLQAKKIRELKKAQQNIVKK